MFTGNLIFHFYCPAIIRNYASYTDFVSNGRSSVDLLRHVADVTPGSSIETLVSSQSEESSKMRDEAIDYLLEVLLEQKSDRLLKQDVMQGIDPKHPGLLAKTTESVVDNRPRAFAVIKDASGYYNPNARYLTSAFYLIAISCFTYVVFQNLYYVIVYTVS